ncbi:MAG TPA: hypothetical protein VGA73_16185 [Candidatus Binatia bacterium]
MKLFLLAFLLLFPFAALAQSDKLGAEAEADYSVLLARVKTDPKTADFQKVVTARL